MNTAPTSLQSQSKLSLIARTAILTSTTAAISSSTKSTLPIYNNNHSNQNVEMAPSTPSQRILQTMHGSIERRPQEKSVLSPGLTMTPATSAPSTAPTSPRLLVNTFLILTASFESPSTSTTSPVESSYHIALFYAVLSNHVNRFYADGDF